MLSFIIFKMFTFYSQLTVKFYQLFAFDHVLRFLNQLLYGNIENIFPGSVTKFSIDREMIPYFLALIKKQSHLQHYRGLQKYFAIINVNEVTFLYFLFTFFYIFFCNESVPLHIIFLRAMLFCIVIYQWYSKTLFCSYFIVVRYDLKYCRSNSFSARRQSDR